MLSGGCKGHTEAVRATKRLKGPHGGSRYLYEAVRVTRRF